MVDVTDIYFYCRYTSRVVHSLAQLFTHTCFALFFMYICYCIFLPTSFLTPVQFCMYLITIGRSETQLLSLYTHAGIKVLYRYHIATARVPLTQSGVYTLRLCECVSTNTTNTLFQKRNVKSKVQHHLILFAALNTTKHANTNTHAITHKYPHTH